MSKETLFEKKQTWVVASIVLVCTLVILPILFKSESLDYGKNYIEDHGCEYFIVAVNITSQDDLTIYRCAEGKFYARQGNHAPEVIEEEQDTSYQSDAIIQ